MSKTRDRKELARQVSGPSAVERRYVTMAVRPLRLAFVINVNVSRDEVLRYLTYNTSIWGGIQNCLIPTDGHSLRDDWWAILQRHDPDKVIFCGDNTPVLMKEVENKIQPYSIWTWSDKVDEDHTSGRDGIGNIPMRYILRYIRAEHGPSIRLNLCLPSFLKDSLFRLYIAAQIGVTTGDLTETYTHLPGVEPLDFGDIDFQCYLSKLSEYSDHLSPLELTRWKLSSWTGAPPSLLSGFHVILCSEDSVEDVCLFWNLRKAPSMRYKGKILVPIDLLRNKSNLQTLADWCNDNVKGANFLTLTSATVGKRRMIRLRDRLKPLLAERFQMVNVWYDRFSIEQFRVYEAQIREGIVLENRTFSFRKPLPSFAEYVRSGMEWVVDIDFRDRSLAGSGFIPPVFPGLARLLSGEPPDWVFQLGKGYLVRMAQEQLACRVDHSTDFVKVHLPDEEQLFTSMFQSYGYKTRLTDTHRYIRGMIGLLGTYEEANLFKRAGLRDLLSRMQKGDAYTFTEMKGALQPGRSGDREAADLVADMALKGIFLRGYNVRCPACDLRQWYYVRDVAETMKCAGCLTILQPSIEAPFHYRLNGLMIRGLDQGAIPVLLTALVLAAFAEKSYIFLPSLEVEKAGDTVEIDLLAACNGHLILAECKDLREGCSLETVSKISEQLSGIIQVAQDINAGLVFLSILSDTIPDKLEQDVARLRRQNKNIAIHMLLKADLERGFMARQDPNREVPVSLWDLFPRQRPKKIGWEEEPGVQKIAF